MYKVLLILGIMWPLHILQGAEASSKITTPEMMAERGRIFSPLVAGKCADISNAQIELLASLKRASSGKLMGPSGKEKKAAEAERAIVDSISNSNIDLMISLVIDTRIKFDACLKTLVPGDSSFSVEAVQTAFVDFFNALLCCYTSLPYMAIKGTKTYDKDHAYTERYKAAIYQVNALTTDLYLLMLPYAPEDYLRDLTALNLRYVGSGTMNDGGKFIDPTITPSIKDVRECLGIITPYGLEMKLPRGVKLHDGGSDKKDFSSLGFTFSESRLEVILGFLDPKFARRIQEAYKGFDAPKAEVAKGFTEAEIEAFLAEEIHGPTKSTKGKVKQKDLSTSHAAVATETDEKACAAGAGVAVYPSMAITGTGGKACVAGAGTAVDEESEAEVTMSAEDDLRYVPLELRKITLYLAEAQSMRRTPPIERIYRDTKRALKDNAYISNMLANLLHVNDARQYGELKSVDSYTWSELVFLLKELGWNPIGSQNSGYFKDKDGKVFNIHYPHNISGHKLYPDLISIMFSKLEAKGYSRDYLIGLLPNVKEAA